MSKAYYLSQGKWPSILQSCFGFNYKETKNSHGRCPMCKGNNKYRFDDKEGRGTWICSTCGAGDGFALVMRTKGISFRMVAQEIEGFTGTFRRTRATEEPKLSDRARKIMLREVYSRSKPIAKGCPGYKYLVNRSSQEIIQSEYSDLRYGDNIPLQWNLNTGGAKDNGSPALIAIVRDPNGKAITIHRTYIRDGKKADMTNPKRMMPGSITPGSAIRLHKLRSSLGICEGIETSLGARFLIGHTPIWPVLNTSGMKSFLAPKDLQELYIFADNDRSFAGHEAAYICARKNQAKYPDLKIIVHAPKLLGDDFLDVANRPFPRCRSMT